jgi:myosin V
MCSTIRGIFFPDLGVIICFKSSTQACYMCHFSMENVCLQDLKKYKLGDPSLFHYLNQSACIKVDGINDAEEYLATRKAMDTVGITDQEQV